MKQALIASMLVLIVSQSSLAEKTKLPSVEKYLSSEETFRISEEELTKTYNTRFPIRIYWEDPEELKARKCAHNGVLEIRSIRSKTEPVDQLLFDARILIENSDICEAN